MASTTDQRIVVDFENRGSVPFSFTSYTVVYRQFSAQTGSCAQPANSPICSLGGAAGRRYSFTYHQGGLTQNTSESTQGGFSIHPITNELLDYIGANSGLVSGGIDLDLTFFGSDHNGHDVTVDGTIHVEIF